MRRGGDRNGEWPLTGGFRHRAGVSVSAAAPSPHPAHRTGRPPEPAATARRRGSRPVRVVPASPCGACVH